MKTYVECLKCKALYSIETQGGNYVFVLQTDIQAKEQAKNAWSAAARALVQSNEAVALHGEFKELVRAQPSMAATFRLFEANGLARGTEGTFRRNWQGIDRWIQSDYFGSNLGTLMKMTNTHDPVLQAGVANVQALYAASNRNLPVASVIVSTSIV